MLPSNNFFNICREYSFQNEQTDNMDSTQKAKIRNVLMGLRNFQKPSKYACAEGGAHIPIAHAPRLPEPTKNPNPRAAKRTGAKRN